MTPAGTTRSTSPPGRTSSTSTQEKSPSHIWAGVARDVTKAVSKTLSVGTARARQVGLEQVIRRQLFTSLSEKQPETQSGVPPDLFKLLEDKKHQLQAQADEEALRPTKAQNYHIDTGFLDRLRSR